MLNINIDNQSPPSSPCDSVIRAPTIINKVNARSHNKNPQYCLVPEEWNIVWNNSQQILVFCTYRACPTNGSAHHGVCKGLIYAFGVKCTIDNLLGASLPIAMSAAYSMFVLQAQNWVIQIEDVLSLNYTHLWVNMGIEGFNCALLWVQLTCCRMLMCPNPYVFAKWEDILVSVVHQYLA